MAAALAAAVATAAAEAAVTAAVTIAVAAAVTATIASPAVAAAATPVVLAAALLMVPAAVTDVAVTAHRSNHDVGHKQHRLQPCRNQTSLLMTAAAVFSNKWQQQYWQALLKYCMYYS